MLCSICLVYCVNKATHDANTANVVSALSVKQTWLMNLSNKRKHYSRARLRAGPILNPLKGYKAEINSKDVRKWKCAMKTLILIVNWATERYIFPFGNT